MTYCLHRSPAHNIIPDNTQAFLKKNELYSHLVDMEKKFIL